MYHLRRAFPVISRCLKEYPCSRRNLRTSSVFHVGAYDGDGCTTVSVLNKEYTHGLLIDTVNQFGFRLNNGSQIVGPLAIFNKCIFSWNVRDDKSICLESLSLFLHLEPRLDVLIIGLSDFKANQPGLIPVISEAKQFCNLEVLPTERAIAAFNFLVSEGRVVGAGLLPPTRIIFTENDMEMSKTRSGDVFDVDVKWM